MGFPINPPNAPLVDKNGLCSREWYKFFLAIQRLLGTSETNPLDDSVLLGGALSIGDTVSLADLTALAMNAPTEQSQPVYLFSVLEPGTLSAGTALSGGGNMGANVTLRLADTAVTPGTYGSASQVAQVTVDQQGRLTAAVNVTITPAAIGGVPDTRTLTAGAGLTGGGDLSANRTFDVGAGTGITVNANDVALDTTHVRNVDHSGVTITAGAGLTGGGTIESTRTLDVGAGTGITVNANDVALDTSSTRNTDHSGVTLTAGAGLTGGGDISASRSFAVGAGTGITVNADDVAIDTSVVVTLTDSQTLTNKSLTAPTLTGIVLFTNGDSSAAFTNPSARLGYNGTDDYAHFIHTRHNNSATLNAIDFYTSDGTQNGTFPANAIHGFTLENTNLLIGTTTVTGSSQKTIHIANGTAPGSTPSGGGVLYIESGALKYIGSSGTTTTVAPA